MFIGYGGYEYNFNRQSIPSVEFISQQTRYIHGFGVGSMSGQRHRRWANVDVSWVGHKAHKSGCQKTAYHRANVWNIGSTLSWRCNITYSDMLAYLCGPATHSMYTRYTRNTHCISGFIYYDLNNYVKHNNTHHVIYASCAMGHVACTSCSM